VNRFDHRLKNRNSETPPASSAPASRSHQSGIDEPRVAFARSRAIRLAARPSCSTLRAIRRSAASAAFLPNRPVVTSRERYFWICGVVETVIVTVGIGLGERGILLA